jgi:hypothetical protein
MKVLKTKGNDFPHERMVAKNCYPTKININTMLFSQTQHEVVDYDQASNHYPKFIPCSCRLLSDAASDEQSPKSRDSRLD